MENSVNLVVEGEGGGGDVLSSPAVGFNSGPDGEADATGAAASTAVAAAASKAASTAAGAWKDSRPLYEQIISYPVTSLLAASFIVVFVVMARRRVSPAVMGSSYRHLVVRSEWWRVLTAAFAHRSLLHLAFNIMTLWECRRMEADLGSLGYLLASGHVLVLSEIFEKLLLHALLMTGRFADDISIGYSGVIFSWMTVISFKPDQVVHVAGFPLGGFMYVLFNLVFVRIFVRESSFIGHLAGIWAGLVFSTGGLDFMRQRYWGTGVVIWALALVVGSLKATTTIPVPLVDYVDVSRRNDLGVGVVPFDWSNREDLEDYVVANV